MCSSSAASNDQPCSSHPNHSRRSTSTRISNFLYCAVFFFSKAYFCLQIIPHEPLVPLRISPHRFPQVICETLLKFASVNRCCNSHGQFYYEDDGEAYCKLFTGFCAFQLYLEIPTLMRIEGFSLTAPKQPRKATMKTMAPATIRTTGGTRIRLSMKWLYSPTSTRTTAPATIIPIPDI